MTNFATLKTQIDKNIKDNFKGLNKIEIKEVERKGYNYSASRGVYNEMLKAQLSFYPSARILLKRRLKVLILLNMVIWVWQKGNEKMLKRQLSQTLFGSGEKHDRGI